MRQSVVTTRMQLMTDHLNQIKQASATEPILEEIRHRWSPRGLSSEPIAPEVIRTILEAGRWAASAFNEQPWRVMVGMNQDETWQKIASTLDPFNQTWAKQAPVLMLVIGKHFYSHNHTPNHHYAYDVGQMAAYMTLQAIHVNVYCHQMAGFDPHKAAELFDINPEEYTPLTVIAFAYRGSTEGLNDNLREREQAPRTRKPASELFFKEHFGQSLTE